MRTPIPGRAAMWPHELFPGLPDATARLCAQVLARVDTDGAVRDPCRSRVLESALTLRLLELTGHAPGSRAALSRYLNQSTPQDPAERMLKDVALHGIAGSAAAVADRVIGQSPEFTGQRKRALLEALFALWGAPPALLTGDVPLTGLHSWARVQVSAVKTVLADTAGRPGLITDEDVRRLLDTQKLPHAWEGNLLISLWVLHALARLPGTEHIVADGVRKVLAHQRADGGLPFVSDTDTWCTATAGIALAAAGMSHLRLRPLAAHLLSQQRPGGGWTYTDLSDQTDVDDTSVAVQFLHLLDPHSHQATIGRGISSMLATRGTDGGFPTYLAGAPSEASMTAAVLDALSTHPAEHAVTISAGLEYLAKEQNSDGSFPPDWSSSRLHTVFRVLLAASRHPAQTPAPVAAMTRRALGLVREQQHLDGGWGAQEGTPSDAITTAYGLIALCLQDDPRPAARALTFLLGHQREDGGITAPPDSIGPRPFVFTVPALADIFTLLALGHLGHRIQPLTATGRGHEEALQPSLGR